MSSRQEARNRRNHERQTAASAATLRARDEDAKVAQALSEIALQHVTAVTPRFYTRNTAHGDEPIFYWLVLSRTNIKLHCRNKSALDLAAGSLQLRRFQPKVTASELFFGFHKLTLIRRH